MHSFFRSTFSDFYAIKIYNKATSYINTAATDCTFLRISLNISTLCYRKVFKQYIGSHNFEDTSHAHRINYMITTINCYWLVNNNPLYRDRGIGGQVVGIVAGKTKDAASRRLGNRVLQFRKIPRLGGAGKQKSAKQQYKKPFGDSFQKNSSYSIFTCKFVAIVLYLLFAACLHLFVKNHLT